MKAIKPLILIAISICFFTSCEPELMESYSAFSVKGVPHAYYLDGEQTEIMASEWDWIPYASSDQDWCEISPDKIMLKRNESGVNRIATITIKSHGVEVKKISIIQESLWFIIGHLAIQKNNISSNSLTWTTANNLCKASRVGGYSDWRLPTISEMEFMYENRYYKNHYLLLYIFDYYAYYWSSSSHSSNNHYYGRFNYAFNYSYLNDTNNSVVSARAVRTIK